MDQAKHVEREEVASPTAEIIQEIQGWIRDLNNTQTVETSIERVQITEIELSKSLIDQILNDDNLLILTNNLQNDENLAATIGVLLVKFVVKENQLI